MLHPRTAIITSVLCIALILTIFNWTVFFPSERFVEQNEIPETKEALELPPQKQVDAQIVQILFPDKEPIPDADNDDPDQREILHLEEPKSTDAAIELNLQDDDADEEPKPSGVEVPAVEPTTPQPSIEKRIAMKLSEILQEQKELALDIWLNKGKLADDNDLLVDYVREKYLIPPDFETPYALTKDVINPSEGQVQSLWSILENLTDGFFIDCGAHDGEFISNSLWLEKEKKWNGLLIEADPNTFATLQSKHRKAWHANLCLSNETIPKTVSFFQNPRDTGLNGMNERKAQGVTVKIEVQCIPLYTILLAMNRSVVDFFSLDIEGFELDVLKTIPFDKIFIKTFAIEHWSIPEGASGLEKFMISKEYKLYATIKTGYSQDSIFVHSSLLPQDFERNATNVAVVKKYEYSR